jgi:hypothetical protein
MQIHLLNTMTSLVTHKNYEPQWDDLGTVFTTRSHQHPDSSASAACMSRETVFCL